MVNIIKNAEEFEKIPDLLDRDGYVVISDVYSVQECVRIKKIIEREKSKSGASASGQNFSLPNALHLIPELGDVVTSPKLIGVMNKVFDGKKYCFTSHSDIHVNTVAAWHKDDGKGSYFEGLPDYFSDTSCRVYKVGLYLQDTLKHGGLTVKSGSHKSGYSKLGMDFNSDDPEVYLPASLGDIVIFDVRITHKGDSELTTKISHRLLRKLGIIKDKNLNYERYAMFFSFGLDNEYTRVFSHKNMERQIKQLRSNTSKVIPEKLKNDLSEHEIGVFY